MTAAGPTDFRASRWAIWAALIAVYLIWGSTYLAIRYAVETLPPFLMAGVRFIVSGSFLYFLQRARGEPRPRAVEWRNAGIIGLLLLVGGNGGVCWAEQFISSGLVALLVATVPIWMVLIDAVGPAAHRPGLRSTGGILIGFGGVVLLIDSVSHASGSMNLLGAWVVVLASFFWALGSIYGRGAQLPAAQLLGTAMEMLTGGVALILVGSFAGEWRALDLAAASLRSVYALVYLTLFGSVAFVAYVWLLRVAPTPLVSTYAYVNPLVAVALGHFLAQEPLTIRTLVAAALIIGSVALVSASGATKTVVENYRAKAMERQL